MKLAERLPMFFRISITIFQMFFWIIKKIHVFLSFQKRMKKQTSSHIHFGSRFYSLSVFFL